MRRFPRKTGCHGVPDMNVFRELVRRRELLLILIQRNIKIRYKNSALGFFWTLLSPVLLIAIYYAFLRIIRFSMDLPALVVGIVVWQYLAMCAGDSLHIVIGNVSMVKKSAFPRLVLPLSLGLANLVNFLLSMAVVVIYLLIARRFDGAIYLLPAAILAHIALAVGMSCLFGAINVYFRDLEHIVSVFMMAWFFMTPIIYPIELFTDKFGPAINQLFFLNPMTGIVVVYRAALLGSPLPQAVSLAPAFLIAAAVCACGIFVFQRLQRGFADVL